MTFGATAASCGACGTQAREGARFCDSCGSPIESIAKTAEYKQVTVLFADVTEPAGIAAAVGAERLREIMADLVNRCTAVVQRYGGTVDKFTGHGVRALFGVPIALEDHAFRACLAALDIQREAKRLADDLDARDRIDLALRVGLNSGQVIAGEIASGPLGYTVIGDPVGLAQRMQSVARAGGVMLSESTARLVEYLTVLGDPEVLQAGGESIRARRLLGVAGHQQGLSRRTSTLVGRQWELAALTGMLDRSLSGRGCVAGVVGPPGIGKSRIVAEIVALAETRGAEVFSTFCQSHESEIAFHAVAPLLRTVFGIGELTADQARVLVRDQVVGADPADLVLLEDMLGIRDPAQTLPKIAADARRRRLTALVDTVVLARSTPRVFVIEDAHWIDQVSEALVADFLSVIAQTHSLVVITYRPEYRGPLSRIPGGQTVALAPLDDAYIAALLTERLGADPSVAGLTARIAERAAGNPFFAEEIVRDLVDRGVLRGVHGNYVCEGGAAEVSVPATLQAAIAARIDRLDAAAKRTLNAASVIGFRFDAEVLGALVDDAAVAGLIDAELVDQVMFSPRAEYAFRHPLIHAVAYQSQLTSERAELHRSLGAAIQRRNSGSLEENAALIAEHLEAAGDLHEAFAWHMRAGNWSTNRDIRAARMSWDRARQVADRLPADDPARPSMRVAPRTLLCGSSWRAGSIVDTGFDELRQLAQAADDKVSLAIGMAGQVTMLLIHGRYREASGLASEYTGLIESIGDPTLTVALVYAAMAAKRFTGEAAEVLRLGQLCVDLAGGDARKGNLILGSPLAVALTLRGTARSFLGQPGWKDDIEQALTVVRGLDPQMRALIMLYAFGLGIADQSLLFGAGVLQETAEMLAIAERSGEDFTLAIARFVRGIALVHSGGDNRAEGFELLAEARDAAVREQLTVPMLPVIELENAKEQARTGDLDGAIESSRALVEQEYDSGEIALRGAAVAALVEALLARGSEADLQEAHAAVDRLAAVPTEPGFIVFEVVLSRLRALLARAAGDEDGYRDFARHYRELSTSAGFEGHAAIAEAML